LFVGIGLASRSITSRVWVTRRSNVSWAMIAPRSRWLVHRYAATSAITAGE